MGATKPSVNWTPEIVWEEPLKEIGSEGYPKWSRLIGTVTIGGVFHHIEGWAVGYHETEDEGITHREQHVIDPESTSYDDIVDRMVEGAGETVTINGHEYFMVVTPFQA